MKLKTLLAGAILLSLVFARPVVAATADEIAAKNAQIQEIQRQIDEYQRQIDTVRTQKASLEGELKSLNAQVNQITLELKSLNLSISNTNLQISDTQSKIGAAVVKISKDQSALAQYIRVLYQNDQETLTSILIKNIRTRCAVFFRHNSHITQRLSIISAETPNNKSPHYGNNQKHKKNSL